MTLQGKTTWRVRRTDHRRRLFLAIWATAAAIGFASAAPLRAEGLEEALGQAYRSNPTLDAARAQLRATDEQVPQALSGQRPSVQGTANYGARWSESVNTIGQPTQGYVRNLPHSVGVEAVQPIYRGGSIDAGIQRAENLVLSQRANLLTQEQSVLLSAVTAFLDVLRDQSEVELNINNEQVLRRQLQATQDRFRVGEITKTDVSQAEARLAGATAARIQSEGNLRSSRATFVRVVGSAPGKLSTPKVKVPLPKSLDEATALAQDNNPAVIASVFAEAASRNAIDVVDGELWPQFSLRAGMTRTDQQSSKLDNATSGQVTAQLTIPLYTSGSVAARAREARQTAGQRRIQIEETRRQVRDQAIKAWEALVTTRASIVSFKAQIRSNEIALEGVRQEATVGTRTVLDTLNAEQELLNSRVGLVRATHDELVATYNLLSAVGQLTAQQLKLPVDYYDYEAYYRSVRNRWWGTGIGE